MGDDLNLRKNLKGSRQIISGRHFDRLSRSRHESIKSKVAKKRHGHFEARRLRSWLRQRGILRRLVSFRFITGRGWVGCSALATGTRPKGHLWRS
jgi:hypothetical protein